jgi:hypothetical protein
MRKILLLAIPFILNGATAICQTTATDFTATDCSSTSHTLFTELNAGKIVVLVWVMPCASCISDAKAGYDAVQSFATAHPNKVLYWMADDAGNTSCSALSSWASTNAIGPASATTVFFGNSGNTINESNYGGIGMPHVVVMGGSDHHIYYNQLNGSGDGTAITNAINTALAASTAGVSEVTNTAGELKVFPNPAMNNIAVSYSLNQSTNVSAEVFDIIGNRMGAKLPEQQMSGGHKVTVPINGNLANGLYLLKLTAGSNVQVVKFTVAR